MVTAEILDAEARNVNTVALHSEGMYWYAYERSAYIIDTQLKIFKARYRRTAASADGGIVSISFPESEIQTLFSRCRLLNATGRMMVYGVFEPVDEAAFADWKQRKAPQWRQGIPPAFASGECAEQTVLRLLRDFDLRKRTPLECRMFLMELKKLIDQ